jgi:hypothetical protein
VHDGWDVNRRVRAVLVYRSGQDADAAASGAIAYVSKEHLSAAAIQSLWSARQPGAFVSV